MGVRTARLPAARRAHRPAVSNGEPGSERPAVVEHSADTAVEGHPVKPGIGERHLDLLHGGCRRSPKPNACKRPINARAKTAGTSGMFRLALKCRRTIVPAAAFHERKAVADGKQPYARAGEPAPPGVRGI